MSLEVSLRHAFAGFTLDVEFRTDSGVTALFGRSGAGKSTVVAAIGGQLRPRVGRVRLGERVLLDTAAGTFVPIHRRRIGQVFQEGRLFPHLTVRQNLLFGRWFAPRPRPTRELERIVAMLGIEHLLGRRPGTLSGGEKQRVAIGRALLADPAALVMDEPLAALDEARKAEILPYVERLRDDLGLPIVYVSHSLAEVARLATTIVLLSGGRVERIGTPSELLADPTLFPLLGRHEAGAVLQARILAHDAVDGLTLVETAGGRLTVPRIEAALGATIRLRVRARDVILATERPRAISALNILPAVVTTIGATETAIVDVQLACGTDRLLARITRRSLNALALEPGRPVFAILKSIAVGRRDIGLVEAADG